jgi:glycosyltransferase involved in cell wall biosynthesis
MPKVSAVIAVKNMETTIASSLESLLWQTMPDLSVIVVDNGSTDATVSIVERLMAKDPRVSLQQCSEPGPFACRNQAMNAMDCDYMAVMDGDDLSLPYRFEEQLAALETQPALAAVGSRVMFFGDKAGMPCMATSAEECQTMIGLINPCCHPSLMVRRSVLDRCGLYDLTYRIGGDFDFTRRLIACGGVRNLEKPLLLYRIHDKQITAQRKTEQRQTAYSVLKKHHAALLGQNEISDATLLVRMGAAMLKTKPRLQRQALRAIKGVLSVVLHKKPSGQA